MVPVVALLYVVRDLFDAYADLEIVSSYRPVTSIEYLFAKQAFYSQTARAASLVLLTIIPILALLNVSTRSNITLLFYGVSLILAFDGVKSRRARKRRIALLEETDEEPSWPDSLETQ